MCGIAGYWNRRGSQGHLGERLERAVAVLDHRGPDDHGVWFSDRSGVGLGHARLSILDLSPHGRQPMNGSSGHGKTVMVYNGEVYNFREIKKELRDRGHTFRGSGDSEVVLAAFEEWGIEAAQRFIGMFAIAFWDDDNRCLHLLRDRVGVKPLYYAWDGGTMLFGSEMKALLSFRDGRFDLDQHGLGEFFQYGYIADPHTIFETVFKLPPGHYLKLEADGEPEIRPYWSVVERAGAHENAGANSESALEEELEALLTESFQYRMVADVPVGVFLSGGIDSSLVTALLARKSGESIRTFTIGFDEEYCNESVWARKIATHLGTVHTEEVLSPDQCRQLIPGWADLFDEPFGDTSGLPTYLVSQIARRQVKVALSADGGDELFCGYRRYRKFPRHVSMLRRLPGAVRKMLRALIGDTTVGAFSTLSALFNTELNAKMVDRLKKLRRVLPEAMPERYFQLAMSCWDVSEVNELIGEYRDLRMTTASYEGSYEEQMMLWDFHHLLPADILTKVDRATMATSLESREPMLDHRLVEFAFRLPLHLRQGHLGTKHLLRKILYRHIPAELLDRPKQGFAIPLRGWLMGELSDLLHDYLDPRRIREGGILNPVIVEKTLRDFSKGISIDVNKVWLLLAFELWRERWYG